MAKKYDPAGMFSLKLEDRLKGIEHPTWDDEAKASSELRYESLGNFAALLAVCPQAIKTGLSASEYVDELISGANQLEIFCRKATTTD